ncbi:MAG: hypothetical protein ACR2N1_10085 [Rubripirellula sp.]
MTKKCTRVAKLGVLTIENRSSQPGDFRRYPKNQHVEQAVFIANG